MEKAIKKALENGVGSRVVKTEYNKKRRESEKIRDLRESKKEKRKILTQTGGPQKIVALEQYYQAQRELRREIEGEEKKKQIGCIKCTQFGLKHFRLLQEYVSVIVSSSGVFRNRLKGGGLFFGKSIIVCGLFLPAKSYI